MPLSFRSFDRVKPWCLAGLLALTACASTDPSSEWDVNKLYSEAQEAFDTGSYEKAIGYYEKLEGRAAGTLLAQQAQLNKAYVHYKNTEPAQAIATIDRFIKLHPASPAMDYALYLKGVANFNGNLGFFSAWVNRDLSERDQKGARESFEAFRELVLRFPNSAYSPDARARMTYLVNSLAQYEVHAARFYFSRGAYVATINRIQAAIVEYQTVPAMEQALYMLVMSYRALGLKDLEADATRVFATNYPQSDLLKAL